MELLNDKLVLVPIDKVTPHPKNPRRSDVGFIGGLIERNGFFGALVVQKSTGYILVGNHRYQAAVAQGAKEVPVLYVDVDDDRALDILLSDNRANDRAEYDEEALADILQAIPELEGTGYDMDALDDLLAGLGQVQTTPPEDFHGGYADQLGDGHTPGSKTDATARGAQPMREVLLYLKPEDYEVFQAAVLVLRKAYESSSTVETVLRAVVERSEQTEGE